MRIATWNVNGLKAREEELIAWLDRRNPDVLGLQEIRTSDPVFLRRIRSRLRAEGYHAAFHGEPRRNGVAILSRHPLNKERRGLPAQQSRGHRLLSAKIEGVSFTTVYVPSAGKSSLGMQLKLAWLDSLICYAETLLEADVPVILCGDFNVAPERVDDWEGNDRKAGCTPAERSLIRGLRDSGWFDLARAADPGSRTFSWWYSPDLYGQDKGLRLDLVFGNRAVLERVQTARTDRNPFDHRERSRRRDHAPVVVDLA